MENLWLKVRECFDTDDGSLPGIVITGLSPEGVAAIYAMLRDRSKLATDSAEFWSPAEKASRPIDSVPNAARLVALREAEAFHHCVSGVISGGVELPVLGVFVFPELVELDYRMGSEWGPSQVAGLFELLRDCCLLAPGSSVTPASQEGPPNPDCFARVWEEFSKSDDR